MKSLSLLINSVFSVFQAADARNIAVMLEAIANGADINWKNPEDKNKTSLIKAVESVSAHIHISSLVFVVLF